MDEQVAHQSGEVIVFSQLSCQLLFLVELLQEDESQFVALVALLLHDATQDFVLGLLALSRVQQSQFNWVHGGELLHCKVASVSINRAGLAN